MKIGIIGTSSSITQTLSNSLIEDNNQLFFFDKHTPSPLVEVQGKEYEVKSTNQLNECEMDMAFYLDKNDYTKEILSAEDRGIINIDMSGSFDNETTIPYFLLERQLFPKHSKIISIPHPLLHVFNFALKKINEKFSIKRSMITILCNGDEKFKKIESNTDLENNLINQMLTLIACNDYRCNLLIDTIPDLETNLFYINLNFQRPFNMDMVIDLIQSSTTHDVKIKRISRDLSVDSGLSIVLEAESTDQSVLQNLNTIYDITKKNR